MHSLYLLITVPWNTIANELSMAGYRAKLSWQEAWQAYDERMANGTQPNLPGADANTMFFGNMAYLLICAVLYLIMMRKKEGFKLKSVIIVYNAICVLLAGYVVVGILLFKAETPGTFACNPLITSKRGHHMAFIFWVFYAQKYWEFLDTWFYILRRSFRQVTFLHLFHHSSITIVVGSIVRFDFSGDMYLPVLLNAFVHVLMYSHYLLTACGIKSWWRPYLTTLQITQFMAISTQSYLAYHGGSTCGSPDFAKLILIVYMGSMIVLFLNFFIRRYVLRKSTASMSGVIKSVQEPHNEVFSGNVVLDLGGNAVVVLPNHVHEDSPKHTREIQYQLTPIGGAMPNLHIKSELRIQQQHQGAFVISGGQPKGRVSWQVNIVNHESQERPDKRIKQQ